MGLRAKKKNSARTRGQTGGSFSLGRPQNEAGGKQVPLCRRRVFQAEAQGCSPRLCGRRNRNRKKHVREESWGHWERDRLWEPSGPREGCGAVF